MKTKIISTIILLFFASVSTYLVIVEHTPKPQDFIFDFTCLNIESACPIKIDQSREVSFKETIKNAIKNLHRLGKLSDVYISVMRFDVYIQNHSRGYIVVGNNTYPVDLDLQCIDKIFAYDSKIPIKDNFVLNDSSEDLVAQIKNYIVMCPGFSFKSDDSIVVPPNSEVRLDYGPNFKPIFKADLSTWLIIFVFHVIVILGLLPLFREGWRFIKKGPGSYFNYYK